MWYHGRVNEQLIEEQKYSLKMHPRKDHLNIICYLSMWQAFAISDSQSYLIK